MSWPFEKMIGYQRVIMLKMAGFCVGLIAFSLAQLSFCFIKTAHYGKLV